MSDYYCQTRIIGDGIRCDQQPPQDDCCNQPAHNYIAIYGDKQWLCAEHYDEHMETRGFLHMDCEGLDALGNRLWQKRILRCDLQLGPHAPHNIAVSNTDCSAVETLPSSL